MELTDLRQKIQTRRRALDTRIGEARALAKRGKQLEAQTLLLNEQINHYDKAILLLTTIGEERQEAAQRQIESLVTNGLQTIFGPTLSFHLVQSVRSKRPEVDFIVRSTLSDGKIIDTAPEARGGGYQAVIGVLLRIVILLLQHKDKETPLILDETFTHLSEKFRPAVGEFLKQLVKETGIQIIMVTHHPEFALYGDKIYQFTQVDGATRVKELGVSDV